MAKRSWKDHLLRSSLPLEQKAAELAAQASFLVLGEYSYTRPTSSATDGEFSVDLSLFNTASKGDEVDFALIDILLECKHVHESAKWVFMRNPEETLPRYGVFTVLAEASGKRLRPDSLRALTSSLPVCVKGFELQDNDTNPHSIERALCQLRYAAPNVAVSAVLDQLEASQDFEASVRVTCLVVVTTAALLVLKQGIGPDEVRKSGNIGEVVDEVEMLVVRQPPGPQLSQYARACLRSASAELKQWNDRLGQVQRASAQAVRGGYEPPYASTIEKLVTAASECVVIVRLESLARFLRDAQSSLIDAAATGERLARLHFDLDKDERRWTPAKPTA